MGGEEEGGAWDPDHLLDREQGHEEHEDDYRVRRHLNPSRWSSQVGIKYHLTGDSWLERCQRGYNRVREIGEADDQTPLPRKVSRTRSPLPVDKSNDAGTPSKSIDAAITRQIKRCQTFKQDGHEANTKSIEVTNERASPNRENERATQHDIDRELRVRGKRTSLESRERERTMKTKR